MLGIIRSKVTSKGLSAKMGNLKDEESDQKQQQQKPPTVAASSSDSEEEESEEESKESNQKQQQQKPPTAAASSSDSEEEESEEESGEEESEKSEQKRQQQNPPTPTVVAGASLTDSEKEEESEEEEEEEEEEFEEEEESKQKELQHKKATSALPSIPPPTPAVNKKQQPSTPTKRQLVEYSNDDKELKRAKKTDGAKLNYGEEAETLEKSVVAAGGEDSKWRAQFERVWSEADELKILNCMIDFSNANEGAEPTANVNLDLIYKFMLKALGDNHPTKSQLKYKMWRLRTKFLDKKNKINDGAGKKRHQTRVNHHQQMVHNLSKLLWGKDCGKAAKSDNGVEASLHELDVPFIKEGLPMIDDATRSELEEEWRTLRLAEAELYLKRLELLGKTTKLVHDAYKKH